jgi:hypothetical protein
MNPIEIATTIIAVVITIGVIGGFFYLGSGYAVPPVEINQTQPLYFHSMADGGGNYALVSNGNICILYNTMVSGNENTQEITETTQITSRVPNNSTQYWKVMDLLTIDGSLRFICD